MATSAQTVDWNVAPEAGDPPPTPSPWHILERLMQELQQGPRLEQQIRSTLEAVRDGLRADAVVWQPPSGQGSATACGDGRFAARDCQRFFAGLADHPGFREGQLLWPGTDGPVGYTDGPSSAVLVRLGSDNAPWLVAVSLDPARAFTTADLDMLRLTRRLLMNQNRQARLNVRLRDSHIGLICCLTASLEAKDSCTAGHSERVARIAKLLAQHMGLSANMIHLVFLSSLLHDIGKISVPDRLLLKPGKLTRKEFAVIQEHTTIGDRILAGVKPLEPLRHGVRSHHERFDGAGYPDGLAGENIPLLGRLLAVADSCDAMMSARRYRPALAPPQIDAVLRLGTGKQWDPKIVEHFLACRKQIYPPIYQKGLDESAFHAVANLTENWQEGSSMAFKSFVPDADAATEQDD